MAEKRAGKKVKSAPARPRAARRPVHPTMGRIAEELGLSRRTVSSVVNNLASERGISEDTAQRVRDYLAERGYVPDRHAVRMRQADHNVFGLMVAGRLYSHLHEAINRFFDRAAGEPQSMEVVACRAEDAAGGLEELIARRAERLIWINAETPEPAAERARMTALLSRFARVVIYNFRYGRDEVDAWRRPHVARVGVDREASFGAVARHLRDLGHRRVAMPSECVGGEESFYMRAMRKAGLTPVPVRPADLRTTNNQPNPARRIADAVREAIDTQKITAAAFGDDVEAAFALKAFAEAGLRVPADLTVTGFDGAAFTPLLSPGLTTLRMPVEAMVEKALAALYDDAEPGADHVLRMPLQIRESSAPPPARRRPGRRSD